jgi:hypothetical protein
MNCSLLYKFPPVAIRLYRSKLARRKEMKPQEPQDEHVNLLQMNLTLLDLPVTSLPADQQRELALSLMELLINAATREPIEHQGNGGQDESETHP